MRMYRCVLVGAFALVAFTTFAAGASASTVTVRPGGALTATAAQTLTFDPSGVFPRCNITLTGNINVTSIASGALPIRTQIGSVTAGAGSGCGGGATWTFLNFPWLLLAEISAGPVIRLILRRAQFEIRAGVRCLYQGDVTATLNPAGTQLTFAAADNAIPFFSGSPLGCPRPGVLQGTMAVSPAQIVTLR